MNRRFYSDHESDEHSEGRSAIFRRVVAVIGDPGAGISDVGLQLQGQRVSTRRTKMKLLINVS
jgi:hypothetical protein